MNLSIRIDLSFTLFRSCIFRYEGFELSLPLGPRYYSPLSAALAFSAIPARRSKWPKAKSRNLLDCL